MTSARKKIVALKEKFKDLATLGLGNLISSGISGIFWFYIAALLGTKDYGVVSYYVSIASIASSISLLGAGGTIIVYGAKGEKVHATVYFVTLIASIISSIVVFFLFFNFGVSLFIIGYVIFSLAVGDILGRKLYKDYSKQIIIQKILFVWFAVSFYYWIGYEGVILGYALSFFPYFIRIYKGFRESKVDFSILRSRWGFMVNNYVNDLSKTFSGNTDKLIIGPMLGFSLLGNYQLGIQFLSLISLLPSIVYQYVLPHDASGNPNKKLKRYTIIISVVIAIIGLVLAPKVIPIFFPKFTEAVQVVQILSLAIIPITVNFMYISKFLGGEKSKIMLIGSGIYLVSQISGILILGKLYGVNGVAASLVLAASSEAVWFFIVSLVSRKNSHMEKNQEATYQNENKQTESPSIISEKDILFIESKKYTKFIETKLEFFIQKPYIALLIVGFVSLFIRLYYVPWKIPLTLDALRYFLYATDTSILGHLPIGSDLANNGWPILLSIFFSIFHYNNFIDYMVLQRLITISISVLTIIPVYLLCRRYFERQLAIVGASIFVFEPHIIQNSIQGITEPFYIFLITVAILFFTSSKKKFIYISFGITGFATLVRPEGLILFIALSIMFFVRHRKEGKVIIKYAIAISTFLLLIIPMEIFRIENSSGGSLTTRLSNGVDNITSSHSHLLTQFLSGLKTFLMLFGSTFIPIFIFFVPLGTFLIFRTKNKEMITILVVITFLLLAAFYAYFSFAPDTRYVYPVFPLFAVLSLFAIKSFKNKINYHNTFLILLIVGILLSSTLFLHFRSIDIEREKEALILSYYLVNSTSGINPYSTASQYIPIAEMKNLAFPVESKLIPTGPKQISTDTFDSLESYLKYGKYNGLTDIVIDDSKRIPPFINDIFYHKEKYPYLTEIFDSSEHGYKYHMKVFRINYEKFNITLQ